MIRWFHGAGGLVLLALGLAEAAVIEPPSGVIAYAGDRSVVLH